jgi:hypothetical protein
VRAVGYIQGGGGVPEVCGVSGVFPYKTTKETRNLKIRGRKSGKKSEVIAIYSSSLSSSGFPDIRRNPEGMNPELKQLLDSYIFKNWLMRRAERRRDAEARAANFAAIEGWSPGNEKDPDPRQKEGFLSTLDDCIINLESKFHR